MALNLGSPGVSVKEIDLTQGAIQGVVDITGAIAGPFEKGPVNEPTPIASEKDLLDAFGNPSSTDNQYEYFLTASQYLSYGGNLQVVRVNGGELSNANAAVGSAVTTLSIQNYDDFNDNHTGDTTYYYAARTPGSYANGLKVCTIDAFADQVLTGVTTTGIVVGAGVTQATTAQYPATDGTLKNLDGYHKGIVMGIGSSELTVKYVSHVSSGGTETKLEYGEGTPYEFVTTSALTVSGATGAATTTVSVTTRGFVDTTDTSHGSGVNVNLFNSVATTTIDNAGGTSLAASGAGATSFFVASATGITTLTKLVIDNEIIDIISVNSGTNFIGIGTDEAAALANRGQVGTTTAAHTDGSTVRVVDASFVAGTTDGGISAGNLSFGVVGSASSFTSGDIVQIDDEFLLVSGTSESSTLTPTGKKNWYDEQKLGLTSGDIFWKTIAPKPKTSEYASSRNSRNDQVHVVVVDDQGGVSGNAGTIIEKHINLSKAFDATSSANLSIYFKDYIKNNSANVYAAAAETGSATGFTAGAASLTALGAGAGADGQNAQDVLAFNACGKKTYTLENGYNYSGTLTAPGYSCTLANIVTGYSEFASEEIPIDFLMMGPSMTASRAESQAKANKLIAIANERKDCMACISPHRGDVVGNANGSTDITNKIIQYYDGITHSSYAVFDSGYKYTFDRFTNSFVYVPTSGDVAGIMARTNSINFPWYSPAGAARGALNNVIKLAYNPTQGERDRLYGSAINPIITTRGQGTILFGDKTSLGKEGSAFSRINVRRLFLTMEESISRFSRSTLFEFNDTITRSNFVNIVDPYLRDIQAKRGITDFRLICDESNNTPDVIDRNEFRADIFIQPARSINYISLTFVATATGASFTEAAG